MEEVALLSPRELITLELDVYKEDALKEKMIQLLSLPGNKECAECGEEDPQWASVSLGVFLCIGCSGHHRNLGVHISRVKSLFLDNWKREELEVIRDTGNIKSHKTWEANLPKYFVRPTVTDSSVLKEQFIRSKYERKEYSDTTKQHEPYDGKEGYLTKKGSVVKNWKKRWFVLVGTVLSYYKKPKDPFPAGVILLKDSPTIDCLVEPIDNKAYCFSVKTPGREFYITAESGKEMFDWVQALRSAQLRCCTTNPNRKQASNVNIKEHVEKLSTGVSIQKRKLNSKTFNNCFIGCSAVDWMVSNLDLASRSEAVVLGKQLLEEGFIQNVTADTFVDDFAFYQFLKTQ